MFRHSSAPVTVRRNPSGSALRVRVRGSDLLRACILSKNLGLAGPRRKVRREVVRRYDSRKIIDAQCVVALFAARLPFIRRSIHTACFEALVHVAGTRAAVVTLLPRFATIDALLVTNDGMT